MYDALLTGVFGLGSVFLGAAVQFWATKYSENQRFIREIRREAYQLYLQGISKLSFGKDNEDFSAANAIVAEARGRIALYGSDEVIMCMNRVFENGSDLHSLKAHDALKDMIKAMRKDSLGIFQAGMEVELLLMMYGNGPGGQEK